LKHKDKDTAQQTLCASLHESSVAFRPCFIYAGVFEIRNCTLPSIFVRLSYCILQLLLVRPQIRTNASVCAHTLNEWTRSFGSPAYESYTYLCAFAHPLCPPAVLSCLRLLCLPARRIQIICIYFESTFN